ncbi:ATP-binding protein [Microvirga lotononidis]|nr:AAA family ATPase [Microvirga lotononidis]
MGELVEAIEKRGGSVLSFEGDSLLAGWKAEGDPPQLASAVWRGCHCAYILNREFGAIDIEGETLTLRSGVAAGTLSVVHLETRSKDRQVILTGPCVSEVAHCAGLAESGEVLISAEAWQSVREYAKGRSTDDMVRLIEIEDPPPLKRAPHKASPELGSADLINYLPSVVRTRLGSPLARWLTEIRTVTILFARVTRTNLLNDIGSLELVVDTLHAKARKFSGECLRIASCEGGLQALIAFGLPGYTHTDDPRRACLSAIELHSAIEQVGLQLSIGIATGDTFCGPLGTPHRAEYTVLGEAVNRAARLTTVAAGRTLADAMTASAASEFVNFQGPWPMNVPGLRTPIATYIAIERRSDGVPPLEQNLVGRTAELLQLISLVQRPHKAGTQIILIEGEAGIGKSALMIRLAQICRVEGFTVLVATADEVERETPYFGFRRVVRQLLGVERLRGDHAFDQIAKRLANRQEHVPYISLLGDTLDLGLNATALTEELSSSVRSENLRRLVRDLILDALQTGSGFIIIEDVQWLDAASRLLLADIARTSNPVTVLLTARDATPKDFEFEGGTVIQKIRLKPLNERETTELAQHLLKYPNPGAYLKDEIWHRTGGNPLFVGEICQALNQASASSPHQSTVTLPRSARAAILGRMDLLPSNEQLVLKISSAVTGTFTVEDLGAIEPLRKADIDVSNCISNLVAVNLLRRDFVEADRFMFSHAVIREVVYASMPSEQREEAHAEVARMLESSHRRAEPETLALILRQWQQAKVPPKEFVYLDVVAEIRLRQYNSSAALVLVDRFLAMAGSEPQYVLPAERLAAAYFTKGEAELNLGHLEAARRAYEDGLRIMKLPLPKSSVGLTASILRQAIRHLFRHVRRRNSELAANDTSSSLGSSIDSVLLKAARVYEDLTRIYYFQGDKTRLIYATLRATALAERVGSITPVLVVNYASLGAICGVIPLRKQAEYYLQLSNRLSEELNNPAVRPRVDLLTGLYKTSVGDWEQARIHFERGLEQASSVGDTRRWCELAVGLETISNPWLFNPIFRSEHEWIKLVGAICRAGLERDDIQVLGCGLAGGLRGYHVLGVHKEALVCLHQLSDLLGARAMELEPIHRLEAAAYLADVAHLQGDLDVWENQLTEALRWIDMVNPTMKSRTLPALSGAFRAAMIESSENASQAANELCLKLASASATKLRRFARIYPIGRPVSFMASGDLEAKFGRERKAVRLWRRALSDSMRLQLFGMAIAARKRLQAQNAPLDDICLMASMQLDALSEIYDRSQWEIAERSAAGFSLIRKDSSGA